MVSVRRQIVCWFSWAFLILIAPLTASKAQVTGAQEFGFNQSVFGQVVFLERSNVAAPRSGVISEIVPSTGYSFLVGDTLFELDCSIEAAQAAVYEAALNSAQIQLQVQEELRDFSVSTDLEVSLAQAERDRAEAELRVYNETVKACTTAAPYGGIVVEKFFYDYEYVREGETVLKIGNPESLAFVFLAPVDWVSELHVGQLVEIYFPNIDLSISMELVEVAPTIEAIGQTVTVTAEPLNDARAELIPGMVGTVNLSAE